jgi:transcriptional regulator with XRE-family HTH domain
MVDKDTVLCLIYLIAMVARIGPQKPRQRAYLREWRKSRQWSQDELAGRMGTTGATISRYEKGRRDYPGGFLARAAEVFEVEEGDLYRLPDTQPAAVPPDGGLDSMLKDAPDSIKKQARAIVEALLKTGT